MFYKENGHLNITRQPLYILVLDWKLKYKVIPMYKNHDICSVKHVDGSIMLIVTQEYFGSE